MMKKITLLLTLLIFGLSSTYAQIFSEDFAGGIPASWQNIDNTGGGLWTYSTLDTISGVVLATTTQANGYALFNADAQGNDGILEDAELITNSFSCVGNSVVLLEFEEIFAQYSIGKGEVDISISNGAWTNLYTVGPGQAQNTFNANPNVVNLDISAQAANQSDVRLRFRYTGDWDLWWVVDDIVVSAPPTNDLLALSLELSEAQFPIIYLTNPMNFNVYCEAAATETVSMSVVNAGANPITSFSASYDNGSTMATESFTIPSLAAGDTTQVTFTTLANIDTFGGYFISGWVNMTGDANSSNDTTPNVLMVTATSDTITSTTDYYTSFEQWTTGPADLTSGWWTFENANNDVQEFHVRYWGPGTDQTTDGDFSLGILGDNSTAGTGADDWAFSPCIYFDQTKTYEVSFKVRSGTDGTNILNENLDFHLCSDDNSASTVQSIGNVISDDTIMVLKSFIFTPNSTGLFNVGLHKNTVGLSWWLWVDEFTITETVSIQPSNCEDIIFSEILEGSGNNKCVELYNPTNADIDLSAGNYIINRYNNGGTTANTVALTGIVPAGGTYVICNANVSANLAALADVVGGAMNQVTFYNGDDALELTKDVNGTTVVLDVFGQIGFDPGSGWVGTGAGCATNNHTLVRNVDIELGDSNGSDAFDPDAEWTCYPIDDDTHLSWHASDCVPLVCNTFTVTNTIVNDTCGQNTGAIDITVTGGYGINTYSWTNSTTMEDVTGLSSGTTYSVTITDEASCDTTISYTVGVEGVAPSLSNSSTANSSCTTPDGTATVTVNSGNAGPYTYLWNDAAAQTTATATGLTAGDFTVTVTGAWGCSATSTATVANSSGFSVSLEITDSLACNGDSDAAIDATVSGGTPTYTYQWSGSSTATTEDLVSLGIGTYTITVTDGGNCTASATTIITQPDLVSASIFASTNVSCNGGSDGSIDAMVSGGTAPYNYGWTDGSNVVGLTEDLSGLGEGTYTLVVIDNNTCTPGTTSVTLTQPMPLAMTNDSEDMPKCVGATDGNVFVSVTGGTSPYTYSWSDGTSVVGTSEDLTNVGAGTYTLSVTDGASCPTVDFASVTLNDPVAITATSSSTDETDLGNNGNATVVASGGAGSYTYSWSDANSQTTATATGLSAGTYVCTIKDANNCSTEVTVVVEKTIGIGELVLEKLVISPNPTTGNFKIQFESFESLDFDISIVNTIGKTVFSNTYNKVNGLFNENINLDNLSNGMYFIKISNKNASTAHKITLSK